MEQHLEATHAMAQTLASDRPEIPEGLSDCIRDMAEMTPRQLLRHQRQRLAELRRLATEMAREDAQVLSEAPQSVRSVLEAASPTGLKVALLHRYLVDIGHEDADALRRDL